MGQINAWLRKFKGGYGHYCPGCKGIHLYYTNNDLGPGPMWAFDGNLERPSFTPSMRIFEPEHVDEGVKVPEHTLCHYFVTDGNIVFCPDSDHELRGQTVPLPELPSGYSDDKYGWPE